MRNRSDCPDFSTDHYDRLDTTLTFALRQLQTAHDDGHNLVLLPADMPSHIATQFHKLAQSIDLNVIRLENI